MIGQRHVAALAVLAIAFSSGCAGDGTGLDEFGNPLGPPGLQLAPTLSSIQDNVFSAICTRCHTGAAAPLGLALDAGVSRGNLVGVASIEIPELLRVDPGVPDSSYIVWKIEGRQGIVGGRMPLGLSPLSEDQISAIREWIAEGAQDN
ncbi:MAG: hypothetical protein ACE5JR_04910 [Gemmatimonadota bacterium]